MSMEAYEKLVGKFELYKLFLRASPGQSGTADGVPEHLNPLDAKRT